MKRESGCQTGTKNNNWKGGKHTFQCDVCSKYFLRLPCYVARSMRRGSNYITCSKGCSNRIYKKEAIGDKNPAWKGGVTRQERICPSCKRLFYARVSRIYCSYPCYYSALAWGRHEQTSPRNFLLYRKLAVEKIDRPLLANEVVHHIDGDYTNNEPSNLEVLTNAEHTRLHVYARTSIRKALEMEKQTI